MKPNVKTYLGFAKKKNSLLIGYESVFRARQKVYLVLIQQDLAENAKKKVTEYCETKKIPLFTADEPLEATVYIPNCKAIGITDKSLSEVIIKNLTDESGAEVKLDLHI